MNYLYSYADAYKYHNEKLCSQLLTAHCPNVLRAHTPKTFNRRYQTSLFKISQCLLNKYEPGRSNLTEIHYHKYLNLCSIYNELNKFSYNKDYHKLFEPSSKAIIDCLTLHVAPAAQHQNNPSFLQARCSSPRSFQCYRSSWHFVVPTQSSHNHTHPSSLPFQPLGTICP